jgi:hypothetical protein
MSPAPETLFLIAGNGIYPQMVIREARAAGVRTIHLAAFTDETLPATAELADAVDWMRVGQLGRMLEVAKSSGAHVAMMAGQLAPSNLFSLRPDMKALVQLVRLKRRNAETLFSEVANQLALQHITLLPATTFLGRHMAPEGHFAGPKIRDRTLSDIRFGFAIAKETSRLDIGQTVVVRHGTVLAVEAFEGTNDCIRRGGSLGRGNGVMVKVTKPNQDMRFDVPVIGETTLSVAHEAGIRHIALEAHRTLVLDIDAMKHSANRRGITLFGVAP